MNVDHKVASKGHMLRVGHKIEALIIMEEIDELQNVWVIQRMDHLDVIDHLVHILDGHIFL